MAKNSTLNADSKALFRKLASLATSRQYGRGQVIFSQGEASNAMFHIEHGNVKLSVASKQHGRAAFAILRSGDWFGEGCIAGNSRRACTATSIQESTIDRIAKRSMTARLKKEPALSNLLISHLLLRIGRAEGDLVDQLVNSSERRLARLLLHLSDFSKLSRLASAVAIVDQATLAQVVGTTRSRVSYFMNRFRKKGLIDYNGSLLVHKALVGFLLRENMLATEDSNLLPF